MIDWLAIRNLMDARDAACRAFGVSSLNDLNYQEKVWFMLRITKDKERQQRRKAS